MSMSLKQIQHMVKAGYSLGSIKLTACMMDQMNHNHHRKINKNKE